MNFFYSKPYLLYISFIVGLCIMVLEIASVRLIGPYFGTSIIVWTNVIAVVLVCLSLGYFWGGRLAERKLESNVLPRILIFGGLSVLIIPLISDYLLPKFTGESIVGILASVTLGSMIVSVLLFGVPIILLGLVSPYLLSILVKKYGNLSRMSSLMLISSTIGGLIGTFLPTVLLISWIGTKLTIILCGLALFITGIPGILKLRNAIPLSFFVILIFFSMNTNIKYGKNTLFEDESVYQYIDVISFDGNTKYMRYDSGFGMQSEYNPKQALTGRYYDYINVLPYLLPNYKNEKIKKVLLIGLAGGTVARQLNNYFGSEVEIDTVEIDPKSTSIAKRYMGLSNIPMNIYHDDGRVFLSKNQKKYDLIYIDTFHNEFNLPWNMTTIEFWRLVSKSLTDSGIVGMNVVAFGGDNSILLGSISQTALSIFSYVYDAKLYSGENSNHLLVASKHNLDFNSISMINTELIPIKNKLQSTLSKLDRSSEQFILSDNKAPIELLTLRDIF